MADPGVIPGVILILAATVVMALVVFNVPMLKSLYFFEGTFSSGGYDGTLKLGTMGYCLTNSGNTTCVGPQIGYSLDLNTLLGVSLFNIPSAVSKWMSYTLVLHIVSVCFMALGLVCGLLDIIPGFNMVCFPTCLNSIGAVVALVALVFDLALFYILKARVDAVSGASASIGPSVWMTLAAWLLACFAGCMYGVGRCCCSGYSSKSRGRRRDQDRERADAEHELRMGAIRDEQRRLKEQSKDSERIPLTKDDEDKYVYEEVPALNRNGSVLQGVGVGYGRRNKDEFGQGSYGYGGGPQRQPSSAGSRMTAGAAGLGAGGAGVVAAGHNNYSDPYAYDPNQLEEYDPNYGQHQQPPAQQQYGQQNYYDPYQNPNANPNVNTYQADPYANDPAYNNQYGDPYAQPQQQHQQTTYPPNAAAAVGPATATRANDYYGGATSAESSGYADPGPRVTHADPYSGYDDDGLGAIGRAVASPTGEKQYTGRQGFGTTPSPTASHALNINTAPQVPVQAPTPKHLVIHNPSSILSPVSDYDENMSANRPPSYGQVAGGGGGANTYVPHEKGRPV